MEQDEENIENADRLTKFRKVAGDHIAMGNKLINVARRMKVNARNKGSQAKGPVKSQLECHHYGSIQ